MFLLVAYFILGCFLLKKWIFFKQTNLNWGILIGLFCLKICAGMLYAYYFKQPSLIASADTWNYFNESLKQTDVLTQHPIDFFKEIFANPYANAGGFFDGHQSVWNNLKSDIFIKILAMVNLFTAKNYYANIVVFNFIFLAGNVLLYKLVASNFKASKWLLISGVFCIPNFLFWQSGLHKDGLIFCFLIVSLYSFTMLIHQGLKIKLIAAFFVGFFFLLILKNYLALLLLPALLCYWISFKINKSSFKIFGLTYLSIIAVIIALSFTAASKNPLTFISNKRTEFLQLKSNSFINSTTLAPTANDFISFFLQAADMAFFQPHFTKCNGVVQLIAATEQYAILLFLLLALIVSKHKNAPYNLVFLFAFFGFSLWLLLGYVIPFYGAIVRYKSIASPFLVIAALLCINPKYLKLTFKKE